MKHHHRRLILISILIVIMLGLGLMPLPASAQPALKIKPLAWPVPPPTKAQLTEAANCKISATAVERYPQALAVADLDKAFEEKTGCDYAILALAYSSRTDRNAPLPEAAQGAFMNALTANPALALRLTMLDSFIDRKFYIVEAPPFASQPITEVTIHHSWQGLGEPVYFDISITEADSEHPIITGDLVQGVGLTDPAATHTPLGATTITRGLVQVLGPLLIDLLPTETLVTQTPCWDDYPDWEVNLTFKDGTKVKVVTNNSNVFYVGGPWQTVIDKQPYVQFSMAFYGGLTPILEALKVPRGEPAAMGCGGMNETLSDFYPSIAPK